MSWWMIALSIPYFFIGGCGAMIFYGAYDDGGQQSKLSRIAFAASVFLLWPVWMFGILVLAVLDDLGLIK